MVPELRAERLQEIARRVLNEFGGNLWRALSGPVKDVRKRLKSFPGIADPGVDRILLFAGISPVAAVPSNCVHVLYRIQHGPEGSSYAATYREAQKTIEREVPKNLESRTRAYLLLKLHGQELCKRTNPRCQACVLRRDCSFASAAAPSA